MSTLRKLTARVMCATCVSWFQLSVAQALGMVQLTCPFVQSGLTINAAGHLVTISPGSVYVNDKLITVPTHTQLVVPETDGTTLRLDTLYITESGVVRLAQGVALKNAPEPAEAPEGSLVLAHIVVRSGPVLEADVLPISRDASTSYFADLAHNMKSLAKARAKLEAGEPLRVMFWGDSITVGANASSPENSFVSLTQKTLMQRFHSKNIMVKNLGVGGSDVTTRIDQLASELAAFPADVIVIEFVNDLRADAQQLEAAYGRVRQLAQQHSAEVVFMNPFLPSPALFGATTYEQLAARPYYQFVRRKSAEFGWALADCAKRWAAIKQEGLRPDLLLADGIVHLNDRGHKMLAEEVSKCFW